MHFSTINMNVINKGLLLFILLFVSVSLFSQNKKIITEKQYMAELEITKLYHLNDDYDLIGFSVYDIMIGVSVSGYCIDLNNTDTYISPVFTIYDNVTGRAVMADEYELTIYLYNKYPNILENFEKLSQSLIIYE